MCTSVFNAHVTNWCIICILQTEFIILYIERENRGISFRILSTMVEIRFRRAFRFQYDKAKQASRSVGVAHHLSAQLENIKF